ncbi:MAG: hypothetical protein MPJ50_04470 [Pirellulales bacterium]|nr:hypothetical protein [Pirellulales bacterium]
MSGQFEPQLLGYLLEALSQEERAEVDRAISENPNLLEELDRLQGMLAPLAVDAEPYAPPAGLVESTCAMIAALDDTESSVGSSQSSLQGQMAIFGEGPSEVDEVVRSVPVSRVLAASSNGNGNGHKNGQPEKNKPRFGLSPVKPREVLSGDSGSRRFRLREFLTVFALASVAFAMLFPAISYSRYNAEVAGCQNNLREVGSAMTMYSRSHAGYFPIIPTSQATAEDRKAGVAGIFSTKLVEDGLLTDFRLLACPAVPHHGDGVIIPSMKELASAKSYLRTYHEMMGGDYGYNLGHVGSDGQYLPTRNLNRDHFAIMGDTPSARLDGGSSDNHGIWGQNLLFESGRVAFVRSPDAGSGVDNSFLNNAGKVAAGLDWRDAVIAPSFARPGVYAQK